ncbi:MAG TPA: hypothetical protein VFD58_14165 [Blastocatellia bacterium]|nr:hypothetical protein [Blastocatellia bacterium]
MVEELRSDGGDRQEFCIAGLRHGVVMVTGFLQQFIDNDKDRYKWLHCLSPP